ncbi:MAG TPA: hypothetical protein VFS39_11930 [Nitrospira sp.]|nr:hypothetical protein [Nitrospira sp.]
MLSQVQQLIVVGVLAGSLGGVAASMLTGSASTAQPSDQTTFQVVRAREFQLIDGTGRTRGRVSFSADGEPYVQLRDEHDVSGIWLGIGRETGLAVQDSDGKTRLILSVDETGNPSLVVRNREHQTRSFEP